MVIFCMRRLVVPHETKHFVFFFLSSVIAMLPSRRASGQQGSKKASLTTVKNVRERCTESILKANTLLGRIEKQQRTTIEVLGIAEAPSSVSPQRWLPWGSVSPSRGFSPPAQGNVSPKGIIKDLWKKLSKSPSVDEMVSPGVDPLRAQDPTPRKSVRFASPDKLESVTPTKRNAPLH